MVETEYEIKKTYNGDGTLYSKSYILNGLTYRKDGPAITYYNSDGEIIEENYILNDAKNNKEYLNYLFVRYFNYRENKILEKVYYNEDNLHRVDGPAVIKYYSNGNVFIEEYWINDLMHRIDGPAHIRYNKNTPGKITYQSYSFNGKALDTFEDLKRIVKLSNIS